MANQTSSPAPAQDGNRRKSGRAVRKPDHFIEETHDGSLPGNRPGKRKRVPNAKTSNDFEDEGSSSDNESSDEEVQERSKTRKPAVKDAKRPKTLDSRTTLAFRSAGGKAGQKTKVQKARARQSQAHQEGLYAEVFGRGHSGADAAAEWYQRYEANNVEGMCEMVNFVLQCTGCKSKVTTHDIEDADNIPNRLGDLQEEYQGAAVTEYPLISKAKDLGAFREVLVEFCNALVKTMHSNLSLYDDELLFENLQTWVDTMSSAGIRPFRHTAALISLSISTALCEIARDLESTVSTARRQAESEQKKKKVNQARVKSMLEKIEQDEARVAAVETILRDEFDVVYVHRYRDVDPKIRVECVMAMGSWILTYRKMFMEGQYLRYLGWLLSDTAAPTRAEVLKQLKLLYDDSHNFAPLNSFTDRFRPRMVEIATRDAEPMVRVHAIALLNELLFAEVLEPEETDIVGQLVFDAEPRVRDQAAKFFVGQLSNVYVVTCNEIVGMEDSALPESVALEDYELPSQAWLYFKFLASTLQMYAGNEDEAQDHRPVNFVTSSVGSRFMLATEAIYPYFEVLHHWQFLAGYLLFDHSSITTNQGHDGPDAEAEETYKLEDGEDIVLLDVLASAVKLYLTQISEGQAEGRRKGRQTQASKEEILEKQETTARHLTVVIPQLLSKYGSLPVAVTSILRLQHLLDLDIIGELQQSEKTCADLLDDINKQFMTHSDRSVLSEASVALLKAKKAEPAKEAVDIKMQEMWDETLAQLHTLSRTQKSGGGLTQGELEQVTNVVSRIYHLASISDCTAVLEAEVNAPSKKQKGRAGVIPLDLLFQFCERGPAYDEVDAVVGRRTDELATTVIKTLLFYFMWKILAVRTAISTSHFRILESSLLGSLSAAADKFVQRLFKIAQSSLPLDPLRLLALSTTLDLFTLFSTLRHAKPDRESDVIPAAVRGRLDNLIAKIPDPLQSLTMATHDRLETSFAKKSHRKLEVNGEPERAEANSPAPDAPPIDSDDEEEANEDDQDDGAADDNLGTGREAKRAATLLAEQSLCEFTGKLVLAMLGGVTDEKHKQRVLRNRTKLGPNYKEVLVFLDDSKKKTKGKVGGKATAIAMAEKKKEKAREIETRDSDVDDDDDDANSEPDEEVAVEDGVDEDGAKEDRIDEGEGEEVNGADAVDEDEIMGD